jgi:hypothetical protein
MWLDDPSRALHRRVTFKNEDAGLVTPYNIAAETEDSIRLGLTQSLAMLTEQNLQIFNRINHTPSPRSPPLRDNASPTRAPSNERVLEWVLERCHFDGDML